MSQVSFISGGGGGGGGGITTIDGNSGSITGTTVTIESVGQGNVITTATSATVMNIQFTDPNSLNTGVGANSLAAISGGIRNTFFGNDTGAALIDGTANTGIGDLSLTTLSTGGPGANYNIALGGRTLQSLINGNENTAIGYAAGFQYNGSESGNITIGSNSNAIAGENNTLRIGTGTGITQTFIQGIDGVDVGSVATVVTEAGDQLGTAVITAGSGISVTPGANTITIATTSAALTWSVITVNQAAVSNNGYICNKAGTLALSLPAASAVGDIIRVTGINNATGWQVTQAGGQQISFGTATVTASLTSSATYDSIEMVCTAANTNWTVLSSIGNITVV